MKRVWSPFWYVLPLHLRITKTDSPEAERPKADEKPLTSRKSARKIRSELKRLDRARQ